MPDSEATSSRKDVRLWYYIVSRWSKRMALCRIDLPWGQVGLMSNINVLNLYLLQFESESRFSSDENSF